MLAEYCIQGMLLAEYCILGMLLAEYCILGMLCLFSPMVGLSISVPLHTLGGFH